MIGESAEVPRRRRTAKTKTVSKAKPDTTTMLTPSEESERARAALIERRSKPNSIADRISGNPFHYRNYYYSGGKQAFPDRPRLQYVERMYPFAYGSPLLVDEPQLAHEIEECEAKRPVMRAMGHRYLLIKPGMTFEDALQELGL
jgi:hypothetical protein